MRPIAFALTLAAALLPALADSAEAVVQKRMEGCLDPSSCYERIVQLAFFDHPAPEVKAAAVARLGENLDSARTALVGAFPRLAPPDQALVLRLFTDGWKVVSAGVDLSFTEMARRGLESPSAATRRAAARLMAERNLFRITHIAIDAATEHPDLRIAALRAIENIREAYGTRWVLEQAADPDPVVRGQALRTIYAIGAPAGRFVRESLDSERRELRNAAIEALLVLADGDDIPRFEAWIEKYGTAEPELEQRVSKAMAEMQAGRYRPAIGPRAPLGW